MRTASARTCAVRRRAKRAVDWTAHRSESDGGWQSEMRARAKLRDVEQEEAGQDALGTRAWCTHLVSPPQGQGHAMFGAGSPRAACCWLACLPTTTAAASRPL
jgi:hypothetical protein